MIIRELSYLVSTAPSYAEEQIRVTYTEDGEVKIYSDTQTINYIVKALISNGIVEFTQVEKGVFAALRVPKKIIPEPEKVFRLLRTPMQ